MNWGGKRQGAGRPNGGGKFGKKTKPIRIPVEMEEDVLDFISSNKYLLPLYSSRVSAGAPSPTDDRIEDRLDLNKYLIDNPRDSILIQATGDSMTGAGIYSGDILVVDKEAEPKHGKIVIASIDNQLTVKRLHKKDGRIILKSENKNYSDIKVPENSELLILGTVTSIIHKL
jgi:DNA polymerase V